MQASTPRGRRRSKGVSMGSQTKHDADVCGRRNVRNMEKVRKGSLCLHVYISLTFLLFNSSLLPFHLVISVIRPRTSVSQTVCSTLSDSTLTRKKNRYTLHTLFLSLSLSLSLSHPLSLSPSHPLTLNLSLSPSHPLTLTLTLSLSLSHSHPHPLTLTLSLFHSLTLSPSPSHSLTLTHSTGSATA